MFVREQLRGHITPCLQAGYGTTETGAISFTDPEDTDADRSESVGQPLPGIEIHILGRDGEMARDAQEKGAGIASAEYLPGSRLVRAFNCIPAWSLANSANREPARATMLKDRGATSSQSGPPPWPSFSNSALSGTGARCGMKMPTPRI